jgi:hypothetical protein
MRKPFRFVALFAVMVLWMLPPAVRADDNLSYDDPGVHYNAPAGWTRVDIPPGAGEEAPVAIFRKEFGKYDTRVITLKIQNYEDNLARLLSGHESDLRQNSDGVFVEKKEKITLSNGMPAYLFKYTMTRDSGGTVRVYEYLVVDGKRSIDLMFSGRGGSFEDKDAFDAMNTLTVVLYPSGR